MLAVSLAPFMVLSFVPVSVFAGQEEDIESVFINNLTTPEKDKELTFATIPENSNYTIESQYWYTSDQTPENKITPESANKIPDETKRYTYQIALTAKDGYKFPQTALPALFGGVIYVNGTDNLEIGTISKERVSDDLKQLTITMYKDREVFAGTIDSVAVNNAILSYFIGAEPRATAEVPDGAHYTILREQWEERTGNTLAYWGSDDDSSVGTINKFSTFKKDSLYNYSVVVKADQGWKFNDSMTSENITLNGKNTDGLIKDAGTDENKIAVISISNPMSPTAVTEPDESEASSTTVSTETGDAETTKTPETGFATDSAGSTSSNAILWIVSLVVGSGIVIGAMTIGQKKKSAEE